MVKIITNEGMKSSNPPGVEMMDDFIEVIADWESKSKTAASIPQPPPAHGKTVVVEQVLKDIQERSDFGLKKYGTRLETYNGRNALWDAYQEAIDLVMYLRQALLEQEGQNTDGKQ